MVALLLTAARRGWAGEVWMPILDHRPEAAAEIAAEGAASPSRALRVQVYLAERNGKKLDRLLAAQQDPSSPLYHRWLSSEEYDRRFGPTQADVDAVGRHLAERGFRVTFASASQGRIEAEGTVATAERAFAVRIAGSRDGKHFGTSTIRSCRHRSRRRSRTSRACTT